MRVDKLVFLFSLVFLTVIAAIVGYACFLDGFFILGITASFVSSGCGSVLVIAGSIDE